MSETIKSQTNCPTCGSEVEVGGETTHFYIPKKMYSEEDMKQAFTVGYNARYKMLKGAESRDEWLKTIRK